MKTQAEIFKVLLDGKKLQHKNGTIVFLQESVKNLNINFNFDIPSDWSIYEEPRPTQKIEVFECLVKGKHSERFSIIWLNEANIEYLESFGVYTITKLGASRLLYNMLDKGE